MRKLNLFVVCFLIAGCSYIQKAPLEFTGKVGGQVPIAKDLAQNTEKLTMAVWVKPDEKVDADLIAIGNHNKESVTASRACLKINWDGRVTVYGRSYDEIPPEIYMSSKDAGHIIPGKWNHVAAIIHYDESRIEIFVNGKRIENEDKKFQFKNRKTPDTPSILASLGGEEDGSSQNLKGKLAHVVVRKKAFSEQEIAKLYLDKP